MAGMRSKVNKLKIDLNSKYLKVFDKIKLDVASDNSNTSESDSDDEETQQTNNDLFVIDTTPRSKQIDELPERLPKSKTFTRKSKGHEFPSELKPGIDLDDTYLNTNPDKHPKETMNKMKQLTLKQAENEELLKKSVLKPGFEQQFKVPTYLASLRSKKKARKLEREKTKGKGWFDLPAPEMTEELKNDLKVLQMRRALDPKHFYKKNDRTAPPKYFQIGTVVEGPADFYHSRIPKKDRKRTIVEELLADAEFRKYTKRKYVEVMAAKPQKRGIQRHMNRLKKRKK